MQRPQSVYVRHRNYSDIGEATTHLRVYVSDTGTEVTKVNYVQYITND